MSYCIDGETPYWGGLSISCKEREYPDAWDWVFKETTRTIEESRKVCKEWDEMANKLRNKLEQITMEEKKTKKMTRAEAFEWLKGKKVLCYSSKMEEVQVLVKSFGFHWSDYSQEPMLVSILFLGEDGILTYSVSLKRFKEHEYEEISANDILSLEIVDEKKKSEEEDALDKINYFGAQIVDILLRMKGHHHVTITETTVALHDEGICLFHSDPF